MVYDIAFIKLLGKKYQLFYVLIIKLVNKLWRLIMVNFLLGKIDFQDCTNNINIFIKKFIFLTIQSSLFLNMKWKII